MLISVDGLLLDFSDEKLVKTIIDDCGSRIKRAFLKCHGSYSDEDLANPQYLEGLWQGLVAAQSNTGGSQAIATARQKRLRQIEGAYKG
ncbi:hypothetical protein [Tolypothrix sp. VBCCA 56010]|uniref:hypothetical protein n=1 Tax=Tolypothrix sp. VBCCA 56010 TaxID=3137731 RepID=UPI003D7E135A